MHNKIFLVILSLICLTAKADETILSDYLLPFDGMSSNCDKVALEKTFDENGAVYILTLLDLAELGNKEFVAGLPEKEFEFENSNTVSTKRFSRYNGTRVKEVFRFEKDSDGSLKSVSLKRYKRSLVRYSYPIGGIICHFIGSEVN